VTTVQEAEKFAARVEAELGYEVDLATELGEDLGWFSLELVYVCEGEEFEGDTDFNLSESGVEPLYAEITVDLGATRRRAILGGVGERLISAEGVETYRYEPTREELAPLLADLEEIHADVFGTR
jgi:hypothetical protein